MKKRLDKSGPMVHQADKNNVFQLKAFQDLEQEFLGSYLKPEVEKIHSTVSVLHPETRDKLLKSANRILASHSSKNEHVRIAACKLLIALLPYSEKEIKKILRTFSGKSIKEIHFTLFCYLDDTLSMRVAQDFVAEVPAILANYLMTVRTDVAQSAWMAGDLLGDHWPTDTAIPVLLDVIHNGKHSVGREAAIFGISKLVKRVDEETKSNIFNKLGELEKKERNKSVKTSLHMVLSGVA